MRQRGRGRERKRKIEGDSRREGEEKERMGTDDCALSFGPHRPESRKLFSRCTTGSASHTEVHVTSGLLSLCNV